MRSHIMRHFVHQADVDHAEGVLEQLHHFGHLRGADRHHGLERLRVEQRAHLGARRRDAADHFGNIRGLKLRIARIDALRREAQEEILARLSDPARSSIGSTSSSVVPG